MARKKRSFVNGVSVHITSRGNNRMDIFHQRQDYATFLTYLEGAVADQAVDVHAFALMTNHVHLIATPGAARAISLVMKTLGEQYVRYYNRQYDRIGTLWNQRYGAKPIEDERYWLTCLRYVEQNPVRAGIIDRPEAYEWSSYAAHAFGRWPEWLTPHPVYLALGKTD